MKLLTRNIYLKTRYTRAQVIGVMQDVIRGSFYGNYLPMEGYTSPGKFEVRIKSLSDEDDGSDYAMYTVEENTEGSYVHVKMWMNPFGWAFVIGMNGLGIYMALAGFNVPLKEYDIRNLVLLVVSIGFTFGFYVVFNNQVKKLVNNLCDILGAWEVEHDEDKLRIRG